MSPSSTWIPSLLRRHEAVLHARDDARTPEALQRLNSLQLADALLRKQQLNRSHPDHPLQIAIIGPTQSGKSTLVNLLLDSRAAAISPLAGFTVHAQGYASGFDATALLPLQTALQPLQRVAARELDAEALDTYVLEPADCGSEALLTDAVVWDTPDFDSIDAGSYRRAVMSTLGIADIVVLAVSKDKYGDKSVWDLLALIQPLQLPLLVCINKLDPQDEQSVVQAFTARHAEEFGSALPAIVLLPFVRRQTSDQRVQMPDQTRQSLQHGIAEARAHLERTTTESHTERYIARHRDSWLNPLQQEREAAAEWQTRVQQAIRRARDQYERDYLNNPDKYDTFNRALAELLVLLEIPGLAPVLTRTRNLVTWPARKLLGLGRDAVDRYQGDQAGSRDSDQESLILMNILDTTLVSLQSTLLDQESSPFWRNLTREFREQDKNIRSDYRQTSEQLRDAFQPQIEAAARRLYAQLQSQPALLNSLRAARATADAAGVALAVKSGGLAPTDLVMAPAMLSVTTLLTESALGRYLDTIKAELREQQRTHICNGLLEGVFGKDLEALCDRLPQQSLYAQRLEPELLAELEQLERN